jgi:hypothetical protein
MGTSTRRPARTSGEPHDPRYEYGRVVDPLGPGVVPLFGWKKKALQFDRRCSRKLGCD